MLAVSVAGPQGWLLLATEGELEKDDAVRKWYERRWTEYFKALKWASKTGRTPTTFESASHAITACRVLQRMARNKPDAPAAEVADEDEIVVLDLAERGMVRAPPENLDVRTFVVDVGRLAGFIHSRRQPLPGTVKIWQGYGYAYVLPGATEQRHAQGLNNGGLKGPEGRRGRRRSAACGRNVRAVAGWPGRAARRTAAVVRPPPETGCLRSGHGPARVCGAAP